MVSAALKAPTEPAVRTLGHSWRLLVAARACVEGGVTRGDLARDLGPLASHRLSPAELRSCIDQSIADLVSAGDVLETRNRLSLTEKGLAGAHEALGIRSTAKSAKLSWAEIRDHRLVAVALGIEREPVARQKQLARPDGLRAAVVQSAFQLPARAKSSPARLRSALAVVALRRAFGKSIEDGLESGSGLSAKSGRLLAGQLAQKPRDFGTDSRLIAALAAEAAGSHRVDAEALRSSILRKLVSGLAAPDHGLATVAKNVPVETTPAPIQVAGLAKPAASARPDLPGFASAILAIARGCAEGWSGNRKAYISDVWQGLLKSHAGWGLTEIEFKSMLAEAHRTGHVVLANADLKDRRSLPRIQQSALVFKNSVLHFVRVDD